MKDTDSQDTAKELPFTTIAQLLKLSTCKVTGFQSGTGFFVNDSGLLITAYHCVARYIKDKDTYQHKKEVTVEYMGDTCQGHMVYKKNSYSLMNYDFCFIQLESFKKSSHYLELGTYVSITEGDEVYFSGYPLTQNRVTIHKGYISSKGQDKQRRHLFTIDGTVVKGHSGGPIVIQEWSEGSGEYEIKVVGVLNAEVAEIENGFFKAVNHIEEMAGHTPPSLQEFDPNKLFVNPHQTLAYLSATALRTFANNISTGIGRSFAIDYITEYQEGRGDDAPLEDNHTGDKISVGRKHRVQKVHKQQEREAAELRKKRKKDSTDEEKQGILLPPLLYRYVSKEAAKNIRKEGIKHQGNALDEIPFLTKPNERMALSIGAVSTDRLATVYTDKIKPAVTPDDFDTFSQRNGVVVYKFNRDIPPEAIEISEG